MGQDNLDLRLGGWRSCTWLSRIAELQLLNGLNIYCAAASWRLSKLLASFLSGQLEDAGVGEELPIGLAVTSSGSKGPR